MTMTEERLKKLEELLNEAVWIGRQNWDGYYGGDNSFHMEIIKESTNYKEFLNAF
jgi:hypothetical protein